MKKTSLRGEARASTKQSIYESIFSMDHHARIKNRLAMTLSILVSINIPNNSHAGELTGYVALDSRIFFEAPAESRQNMSNIPTLAIEPEYYHVSENYEHTLTFKPFVRIDANDDKRNHWDIRQFDWLYAKDDWELRTGVSKVFWGVTESNHLVDIINQTDSIEDTDGEDKLGQPMIQLGLFKEWGDLRLFYMPYFRERTFPSVEGRLRAATPVEDDLTTYDSEAQRFHPDFAIRYANTFGDWDVGLSHFSGTSREPVFVQRTNADGENVLNPHYDLIDQTSLDLQYTIEGWLWKLEAMTRTGHGRRFGAFTGGVEYTFYQIADTEMDLGVLTEYQFDDRSGQAPATLADNDVFAGLRLTFNDIQDTAILGGVSVDSNTQSTLMFFEAERRVGNNWKAEITGRFFANVKYNDPLAAIEDDVHIQLRIARYF